MWDRWQREEPLSSIGRRFDRASSSIFQHLAMTAKLNAETQKLQTENRWYLAVVASGATLAIVAIAKLFL